MGLNQSYMECSDDARKCVYGTPIPYQTYNAYAKTIPDTDTEKTAKLSRYVCGTNPGTVTQCCDPNAPNANLPAPGDQLIKIITDPKTNVITEYQICGCASDVCKKQFCSNNNTDVNKWVPATNYTLCKARSRIPGGMTKVQMGTTVSPVNSVVAANTFPDCYSTVCK